MRRFLPVSLWICTLGAACARDGEVPSGVTLPADVPMPLDPAIEARVDAVIGAMTLEEKAAMLAGTALIPPLAGWPTTGVPSQGVAGFRMTDGPRGVGLAEVSTVFPVGVARAATWDLALEEAVGRQIADEASAVGKDVLLAPTLNLVRHPRWGRAQESYGEEPLVLGRMAAAFCVGAQARVACVPKHFAANSIEATRYDVDVQLDPRTLREVYLPHYREVVRAGGASMMMAAYNQVNGHYATENRELLTDILKDEWGFQGVVMSDWVWGITDGAKALAAGLDLEMPITDQMRGIAERIAAGEVPMARLDDAVRRQLRASFQREARTAAPPEVVASEASKAVARRAALQSMVLLERQEGALPLAAGSTVAVLGALADVANTGDNGSSNVRYRDVVTPLAGLAERYEVLAQATDTPTDLDAVASADAAVVVVGLTGEDEGEGIVPSSAADRESLALSPAHLALIEAVLAVQPRTIVVLEGSGPLLVEPFTGRAAAVVMAWYPGQEGGRALADLLTGDQPFSGHLPMVWPRSEDQLVDFDPVSLTVEYGMLHGWRWMERQGSQARYPFGHGLGLSEPTLAEVAVSAPRWAADGPLTVEGVVRGDGPAVVQVYARHDAPVVERPDRTLVGFARVEVDGEAPFSVEIDPRWLARWDEATASYVVDGGAWTLEVGFDADHTSPVAVEVVAE